MGVFSLNFHSFSCGYSTITCLDAVSALWILYLVAFLSSFVRRITPFEILIVVYGFSLASSSYFTFMAGSEAYESRRFSSGWILSSTPSPANVSASRTLNVPESKTWSLEFLIQRARRGGESSFHRVTFSASMWACRIGTSADWLRAMVIFCLTSYSKKSPADLPSASVTCFPAKPASIAVSVESVAG